MYKICILGAGEIGFEVAKAYLQAGIEIGKIIMLDASPERCKELEAQGFTMIQGSANEAAIPDAQGYIICLWKTEDIIKALQRLNEKDSNSMIFIESTIDPNQEANLELEVMNNFLWQRVVIFPHRYMVGEPEHNVFNLDRLIATYSPITMASAYYWLTPFMDVSLLHPVEPKIAILSKVVENAYRAMEIILAQELKKACLLQKISFDELRNAVNTKWNINIKEARDGVKGKCLPKDLAFFTEYFDMNLADYMELLNKQYVRDNEKK